MINSIATYKESLSRIANEVFDAADELEISQPSDRSLEDSPVSSRRMSRRSSRLSSPMSRSPIPKGIGTDPASNDEIAKYKADIQKLLSSEAEIKELAFSYAAVLKEKEEQLSKLREENGSLRRSLDAKEFVGHASRDESPKAIPNNSKVTVDQSPIRSQRNTSQARSGGKNNFIIKQDGFSNGGMQTFSFDATPQKIANSAANGKEHKRVSDEAGSLMALQASHESEIKQYKAQLDREQDIASTINLKLQEECKLKESSQKELQDLKIEKDRTSHEMKELQKELREKISEIRHLQMELSRRNMEADPNEFLEKLKSTISVLEKEKTELKAEKNELEANLKLRLKSALESSRANDLEFVDRSTSKLNEKAMEEMELSMRKLKKNLEHTSKERDKALQELNRLKQHLLDKELEDSDKMDEDNKIIEELRATVEYQRAHILQLERALKQEAANKEEIKKLKSDELQKSNETINELRQKLANCISVVDSKNVELQNLQTALGQYYAESEAKEWLRRDLAVAREESAKLSESLKAANQGLEMSKRENEEILAKLSQAERMLSEGKRAIQKLEEDNSKLRRALEQNMTRLNRMSLDSDNYVDRRIVIKLLVTYFQRNHSKEVLDLMVRMLGFSKEDKQRIGLVQNAAGRGVVRGVLGLPGRLVGGILGGGSQEASSRASDNQSFADLWVDFLLKETEERERRESEEAARTSSSSNNASARSARPPSTYNTSMSHYQKKQHIPSRQPFENLDSEFATVPLNSPFAPSASIYPSNVPPKY